MAIKSDVDVCVVGSANLDIVVSVPHHPVAGETVLGGDHVRISGGKGANQAVAAARLGRSVAFVGCVGDDPAGQELADALVADGIDISLLRVVPDTPSGIALISVGPDGDNSIVVSPGANNHVDEAHIEAAATALQVAKVTLLQLEVPVEAITEAAESAGGLVILNPAPAQALTSRLLESVDVLVPNETELALLTGSPVATTFDEIVDQARLLPSSRTVVTLGAQGALLVDETEVHHQASPAVNAVDTTAAGDSFCGALADVLAEGGSLTDAMAWGVMVGAATNIALRCAELLADSRRSRRSTPTSMTDINNAEATVNRPKIVLDCDPGVDDMFAILCALRYCDLVAITSVAGNVGLAHTTQNALDIVELAGAHVPVHRGAAGPLNGAVGEDASEVHGESGLGGVTLPAATADIASDDAVGALFDLTASGDTTVVAVGPLTNVALAIQRDSTWIDRVPRLVIMGGSTGAGNATAYAEYNIWADPEAAEVVFDSGVAITMAGLNLTRQVTMGVHEIELLRSAATPTSLVAAGALDFYSDFSFSAYGVKESAMHDPCAVLEVVRPDLFERQHMAVNVETAGVYTRGMTVCDRRANAAEPDTDVLVGAARDEIVDLIITAATAPLG